MEIRKAKLKDLDIIIQINKYVDYENPDEFMQESIEKGRVLVVVISGKIVGFLLYQLIWGKAPLLSLLKIHSDFQKQGLGTALIKEFEIFLKNNNYTNYYSSTGDDNPGSQIFHEKMGFNKVGTLKMKFGNEIYYGKYLSMTQSV